MRKQLRPLPFGEWMPDAGVLSSTARDAAGVYSYGGRYAPLKEAVRLGNNARTNDRVLGHYAAKQSTGQIANFFGDRAKLYQLVNRVMTDVSRPGGYAADADAAWKIDQFNDYVIAACRGAPVQVLELGGTGEFRDLGGGAGEGDTCGRIGPHMIIVQGREMRISAFNNPTDYEPAPDTQAAIAYLDQRGGLCHAVIGGTDVGAIFQERMISRMAYVGGATAFQLDPVEFNRGCLGPNAVATLGRLMFYAAEDGIFVYDGTQSISIGEGKVDRYFSQALNYAYRNRVSLAIDTERKCLQVAFPTGGNPDVTEQLIYSIPDKRWSHDAFTGQLLIEIPKEGVSIDDTAAIMAVAGTTDMDLINISIDSPVWRESRKQWGGIDSERYVVLFEGANRPAVIETAEQEILPGRMSYVSEARPIIDAAPASVTVTPIVRPQRLDETPVVGPASPMNAIGACPMRAEGRYMRGRVNIAAAAAWTEAHGIHTDARPAGGR